MIHFAEVGCQWLLWLRPPSTVEMFSKELREGSARFDQAHLKSLGPAHDPTKRLSNDRARVVMSTSQTLRCSVPRQNAKARHLNESPGSADRPL